MAPAPETILVMTFLTRIIWLVEHPNRKVWNHLKNCLYYKLMYTGLNHKFKTIHTQNKLSHSKGCKADMHFLYYATS